MGFSAMTLFVLRHRSLFGGGKEDLQQIARVIALNMAIGLLSKGIDNWGHLGGLLGGAAISWFLGPAWSYESKSADGRLIYTDKAPIFYLTNKKRTR
ncbi:Rhomboid-like protein 10 protein [Thalictrum thalictroides]|uniref:Rhomboid-like protein 10 protein n=1 Tax=Thalictrum thalictroides TaxID=46969 RepID=A0A7J6X982_THATH|nr:Rhomboid-like protein 10 protein [Thalictrum thalictroides]